MPRVMRFQSVCRKETVIKSKFVRVNYVYGPPLRSIGAPRRSGNKLSTTFNMQCQIGTDSDGLACPSCKQKGSKNLVPSVICSTFNWEKLYLYLNVCRLESLDISITFRITQKYELLQLIIQGKVGGATGRISLASKLTPIFGKEHS